MTRKRVRYPRALTADGLLRSSGNPPTVTEAEVEKGILCDHTLTEWLPDSDSPSCEEGHWRCLSCGAVKAKAYRPFLEVWMDRAASEHGNTAEGPA